MNRTRPSTYTLHRGARGNALVVAVILLLLASVITLLTLNVGLFEQRTSGNDVRAKIIAEVAEAGVAQGAEYFRMVPTALQPGANWVQCTDNDTTCPSMPRNSCYCSDIC